MAIDELVDYVKDRAGGTLRVVNWYTEDDYGTLYIREDLDPEEVEKRVRAVSDRLTTVPTSETNEPLDALGDKKATVQVRENVVILHFPTDKEEGILVSLEDDAARDLHRFVKECVDRLDGDRISTRSPASD
jgi:hypothetical protein